MKLVLVAFAFTILTTLGCGVQGSAWSSSDEGPAQQELRISDAEHELTMSHWSVSQETNYLVFRDTSTPNRDFRVAFSPGASKDFGTPHFGNETSVIKRFADWSIGEENGVLVFRDTFTRPGDFRYAFYPANGNTHNWGDGTVLYNETEMLFRGERWSIAVETGVLVFRDTLSAGDNRYAFWPGQYTDM
jgi:hypothetical protein